MKNISNLIKLILIYLIIWAILTENRSVVWKRLWNILKKLFGLTYYALAVSNLLFLNVRRFYPYPKEIYDLTKETVKNYLKAINFTEDKKFKHKNKENKNKNKKLHIAYISQDFLLSRNNVFYKTNTGKS